MTSEAEIAKETSDSVIPIPRTLSAGSKSPIAASIMERSTEDHDAESRESLKVPTLLQPSVSAAVILLRKFSNVNTENESRISTSTSSSQFMTVSRAIQTTQKSVDNFIEQSSICLRSSKSDSKVAIKGFLINVENGMNNVLRNQAIKIARSKCNIETLVEVDRLVSQKKPKILHLTSYLKSLSRLKHIAEEIVNEQICYHQFLKKFSNKIITEDPSAFEHFHKSAAYLMHTISAMALERMSSGILNQLSCLEQLRMSYPDNPPPNASNNSNDAKAKGSKLKSKDSKLQKKVQEVMEYQNRVISSTSSKFAYQIASLTEEFHTALFNEAKKNEGICNSQVGAFRQILDEISAVYSPLIKVRKSVSSNPVVFKCSDSDLADLQAKDLGGNPDGSDGQEITITLPQKNMLNDEDDTAIRNVITSLDSSSEKCHKSLIKLIDLWDKRLSSLFSKQLDSHKKEAMINLKTSHSVLFSAFKSLLFDTHKLDASLNHCIADIKLEQKKILTMLTASIKSVASSVQIPSAISLLDFDSPTSQRMSPYLKYLSNIKFQNVRATKLISMCSTEFVYYYEKTWKECQAFVSQNNKHLNLKKLKDQKYKAAELMVHNFSNEIYSAIYGSEQMVYELSGKLDLQSEGFMMAVQFSGSKIKASMKVFMKLMKSALGEFDSFMDTCSKHLDEFFYRKSDTIKTNLSQVHFPLKEFLASLGITVHTHLQILPPEDVTKDKKQNPIGIESQFNLQAQVIDKSELGKPTNKVTQSSNPKTFQLLSKTAVSSQPLATGPFKKGSSEQGAQTTDSPPAFEPEVDWSIFDKDPKNLELIERYIHASMKETGIPKWAEVDVN